MANMFENNNNNNYNTSSSQFSGTQIGGGYVGGNENYNSSNTQYASKRNVIPYEERVLSQVTIKQIQTAKPPQPDEYLVIDGREVSQLILFGSIEEIDIQTSHTTLKVNDCTGTIDVKQWHNDDNNEIPETSNLVQGTYVRIVGRITIFQGRCSVNAFKIETVENFNEVTHHFLECIYAHLKNTQTQQTMNGGNNNTKNVNHMNNNNMNQNQNQSGNNNGNNDNFAAMDPDQEYNLNALQKKIAVIIRENTGQAGCDIDVVFKKLPNEDINMIRESVEEMAEMGMVYSTIDEDHYQLSNNQ